MITISSKKSCIWQSITINTIGKRGKRLGNKLGLNYAVATTPQPTFIAGFTDVSQATFTYDLGGTGQGGGGTPIYTLQTTPIPEPSAVLGLGFIVGLGLIVKRR